MLADRRAAAERVPREAAQILRQNQLLLQKIEELQAKNLQREQALPDFEGAGEEESESAGADGAAENASGLDFEALCDKYLNAGRRAHLRKAPSAAQTAKATQDAEEVDKKFRRIAALRKMHELADAQEEEMEFLVGELDKLRKKTYPAFE